MMSTAATPTPMTKNNNFGNPAQRLATNAMQLVQPRQVACEGNESVGLLLAGAAAVVGAGYYAYSNGLLTRSSTVQSETKPAKTTGLGEQVGNCNVGELSANSNYQTSLAAREGQSPAVAVELFKGLADEGHALAQFQLGMALTSQDDHAKAFEWLVKSAHQGFDEALVEVGVCYDMGRGVKQDVNKANVYFSEAYAKGNAKGAFLLSWSYAEGEGVEKDVNKAIELLKFVESTAADAKLIQSATGIRMKLESLSASVLPATPV